MARSAQHAYKKTPLVPFADLEGLGGMRSPGPKLCGSAVALREASAVADCSSQELALGPLEGSVEDWKADVKQRLPFF